MKGTDAVYCPDCRTNFPGETGRCPDCGETLVPYAHVTLTLTKEEAAAGSRRMIVFPGMERAAVISLIPGLREGQTLCVRNARFEADDSYTLGVVEVGIHVLGAEPVPEEEKKPAKKKKKKRKGGVWARIAACLSVLPVTVLMTLLLFYFTAREVCEAAGRSELLVIGAMSLGLLVLIRLTVRKGTDTPRRNALVITVSLAFALLFRYIPPVLGVDLSDTAGKLRASVYAKFELDPSAAGQPKTLSVTPVETQPAAIPQAEPVTAVQQKAEVKQQSEAKQAPANTDIPHFAQRYLLNMLSPEELDNFTALYKSIASFSPVCVFPHQLSKDSADLLTTLILTECPELMQVDFTSGYYTLQLFNDRVRSIDIPYAMSPSEYRSKYAACASVIANAAEQMRNMNVFEKELYVYDLIVRSCEYSAVAPDASNAYGALIGGRAKCDGISDAAKWLLEEAGETAVIFTGKDPGATVGHAWNGVLINGVFCHLDITNDVGNDGKCLYPAFNVPERCLTDIYPFDDIFAARFRLPSVKGYESSYHVRTGCFIAAGGDAVTFLTNEARLLYRQGGGSFTLQFEREADYRDFLGALEPTLHTLYSQTLKAGGSYSYNMLEEFRTVRITLGFS